MRICIDVQAAVSQGAGVGRYTRSLVEYLPLFLGGGDELVAFYFDFRRRGRALRAARTVERVVRWIPGRVVQGLWKHGLPPAFERLAGAADVYHFPNFILPPLGNSAAVATIHDVSFLRFPETTERGNLRYLRARIGATAARADAIITDSRFSADEIHDLLGVAREKLHPIHLGVDPAMRAPSADETAAVRRRRGLERPYILTVGTIEPRKNIVFLIEVFERLEEYGGELVVVGRRGWKFGPIFERMRSSPRAVAIRHLEGLADADLRALYAAADVFVFPSLYEGFGLPPLEAMACGAPVVAAATGSLPEVLGDGADLVKGFDADEWALHLRRVLSDSAYREGLKERGLRRAAGYRWEETARRTMEVYRAVLRERRE